MQFFKLLPVYTLAVGYLAVPTAGASVGLGDVKSRLQRFLGSSEVESTDKYFHESKFHVHYDGRFGSKVLPYHDQKIALKNLVHTYLDTFADLGVETWLMHGSLLGWWWGKKIMPWDTDVDVQVSEASIYYLAAYYNMSVFSYKPPQVPERKNYLLEINPHYLNREQTDKLNVIDARWIDMDSGLFIDITAVRYNPTHPEGEGMLYTKDGHEFRDTYLYPLRSTTFEGSPVKIPFKYMDMLEAEYGTKGLTATEFENHVFSDEHMEWLPKTPMTGPSEDEI